MSDRAYLTTVRNPGNYVIDRGAIARMDIAHTLVAEGRVIPDSALMLARGRNDRK